MTQITNALTIREIEHILYGANPHIEARSWTAAGVECRRDRHRYTGQGYGFTTEVLQLQCAETGRSQWAALIVSERWTTGTPDTVIRTAKWMKLVVGKSSDLRDWIRRHRPVLAV
jgi:hypothetical protein